MTASVGHSALAVVAAVLAFGVVWLGCRNPSRQLARLGGPAPQSVNSGANKAAYGRWVTDGRYRATVCASSGLVLGWLLGGFVMGVVGGGVGLAVSGRIGRLESSATVREREAAHRDLPLAVDLLSACALAGLPLDRAVPVVASSLGGPLGVRLSLVDTRLRLGADPVMEWRRLCDDPTLATLARTVLRSVESGASMAESLQRLGVDSRRERRAATQARARSVGVKAAGPLAACFLPAFMVVGVVPTIAGAFGNLLL